jgi:hypothetical protein
MSEPDSAITSAAVSRKERGTFLRWMQSTSNRTFATYPILVVGAELLWGHGDLTFVPWGLPLLPWGYLQYRLAGNYRTRRGGGGPGIDVPPERLVDSGAYAYTRNPMYLGHLIFMLGLAITFRSWFALALLIFHIFWFQRRVAEDEKRLQSSFGPPYTDYMARVKRWIPGVI